MVVTHGRTGQAVRHEVRPHGVRPGARDDRGGVPRRRRRPRQRHGRQRRRHALRSTSRSTLPAIPSFAPEHFASRPRAATPAGSSSSARASPSSTRKASCRCCATPTSAIRPRCWPRSGPCSSRSPSTGSRTSSARRSSSRPTSYRVARRTDAASAATAPGHERGRRCCVGPTARCLPSSRARTGSTASKRSSPDCVLERLVAEG